jgi:hypothetical protein
MPLFQWRQGESQRVDPLAVHVSAALPDLDIDAEESFGQQGAFIAGLLKRAETQLYIHTASIARQIEGLAPARSGSWDGV